MSNPPFLGSRVNSVENIDSSIAQKRSSSTPNMNILRSAKRATKLFVETNLEAPMTESAVNAVSINQIDQNSNTSVESNDTSHIAQLDSIEFDKQHDKSGLPRSNALREQALNVFTTRFPGLGNLIKLYHCCLDKGLQWNGLL